MADAQEKPSPEQPEPKRRWYQYSLRSLLIVMVLLCFLFAWGGYKIRDAEKQKIVVNWIEEQGGSVYPRYYLIRVKRVYLSSTQVSDISRLAGLANLEHLDLKNTQVTDLSPLEGLSNLQELLIDSPVSREEVQRLQKALPRCKIKVSHYWRFDALARPQFNRSL